MQLCLSKIKSGHHQHRALASQDCQCVLQLQVAPVNHGCQCMCLHAALVPREHARRKRPGQRHIQVCGCVTHTSNCMHQFCSIITGRTAILAQLPCAFPNVLTGLTAVDIVCCYTYCVTVSVCLGVLSENCRLHIAALASWP